MGKVIGIALIDRKGGPVVVHSSAKVTIEKGVGETIEFTDVLMLQNGDEIKVGSPVVDGAKVVAEVVEQGRAKKVHIIKFRRRKHHKKQMGHRQWFTEVKITGISK